MGVIRKIFIGLTSTNNSAPTVPLNNTAKALAQRLINESTMLSYRLETTKDPRVFFDGYDDLVEKSQLLASLENNLRFTGMNPSGSLNIILEARGKNTEEFIYKWYEEVNKQINRLSTAQEKSKVFSRHFDVISKYYTQMSQTNIGLIEKLKNECWDGLGLYNGSMSSVIPDIDSIKDGFQFEIYVAKALAKNDFTAQTTQKSGDYGVDVLAEKDGVKYAIQCKLYSQPVGVKSVQEVLAGKEFYNCHVGVVATNNGFTRAAVELADKTGVLLWGSERITELSNAE